MRLNLSPKEFMALYSELQACLHRTGVDSTIDTLSLKSVSDRMHSCIISALLRKEEGDDRDATHVDITDKLFKQWEDDQKAKIESLKKAVKPQSTDALDSKESDTTKSDLLPPLPDFLMLDEHELAEPGSQYPRKHRQGPPPPQLPKNRKWRGKHKK